MIYSDAPMDSILRKLYECGAYEQRARAALLRAVAARANSPPAPALRPGELSGVLRVGVDIIIGSESPVLAEAALFVVQQFAARDIQWVLDNAVLTLVEPLMSAANQSGHSVSLQLLKWLIVTSSNDTMTSSANDALTSSVGSLLATFVKSRAPLTVSWLSELSLLLTDVCPSALPVGDDACALAEALVHGLCALHPPSEPAAVGDFLRRLWLVQCLCSRVFACDNRCALRAMDALYSAMSPADGGVSVSLSVVLQALPQRLIKPACSELVQMLATTASSSAGGGGAVCSMLVCLCDWLLVWPSRAWSAGVYSGDAGAPCAAGGAVLTVWLAVLIRQLAERRLSHVLVQLTLARVEKLFSGLFLPAFRAAIFPVVSLLLLGFQHSSEAFDKVAASAPSLLRQIGRECANAAADTSCADDCRTQRSQLADLLHTLLFLHSQSSTTISSANDKYSDLRATLQCQDVSAPQPARMTSFLAAARWTPHLASPLAGAFQQQSTSAAAVVVGEASAAAAVGMGVGVAAVSDQRGLANLGNTCFMNAVIQALFAVKHFRVAVLLSRPSVQHRLLAGLQRVFAFLQFGRRAVYTPSMFHRLALPPWFETGRQHDCTEFLRYMLNALNEEHRSIASSSAGADDSVPSPATISAGDRAATTRFPADVRQRAAPVCRRASRSLDDSDTARPAGCGGRARRRRRLSDGDMSVGSEYGGRSVTSATDGERSCDSSDSGIQSGGCVSVSDKPSSLVSDDGSSLVRRLLSGCMETSYTCLGCHTVSRHVDTFTDLNLTFPADRPSLTAPVAVDDNEQHSPHSDVSPSKIAAVDCQHAAAAASSSSVSSPERLPLRGDSWPPNDGADSNGNHLLSASRPDARAVVVHKADDIGCRIGRLPDDDVQMSSVCATTSSGHSEDAGGADCNSGGGGVSVCQLLDYYMSRERLTGDNRYWCEQCGQLRDADRRLRLLAAPGCLLVSLSRFVYDRRAAVRRKLLTPVRLERRLCMRVDDACPGGGGSGDNSEQQQQQAVVYDLQAVVVHSGASLDAGHYYCCARTGPASTSNSASDTTAAAATAQPADPLDRSDHSASTDTPGGSGGEWCRFDDSHVSRVCTEYVQRLSELLPADTAYMLVYVRRQLATAAPPAVHRLQLPEPLRHDIVAENAAAG